MLEFYHHRTIFEEGDTEVFRLLAENSRREAAKIEALLAAVRVFPF